MTLAGLPDWNGPMPVGDRRAYAAFERPGVFAVPPVRWQAVGAGDDPAFRIDVFAQDRLEDGLAEFGLLTARYSAVHDLGDLYATGIAGLPDARFHEAWPESGFAQLRSPADVPLPEAVAAPQVLAHTGTASAATVIRLDGSAADLVIAALRRGLATVRGVAWLAIRGIAARVPATITVDLRAFSTAAREIDPTGTGPVALEALRDRVAAEPAAFGVSTTPEPGGETGHRLTEATLDRVVNRVGRLAPAPDGGSGIWVDIDEPAAGAEATWDLTQPLSVLRFFELPADPLGPLRSLTAAELERTVVRRHVSPAVRTGWHRVTFSTTVVLPLFGVVDRMIEVTVPGRPPSRPQTIREVASLDPDTATAAVTFRVAPSERLDYEFALTTVLASSTGTQVVVGPTRTATTSWTTLRPDDTGLRHVHVEASPALLAEATIHLEATSAVDGQPWVVAGSLDATRPSALFGLPADADDPTITARAVTSDGRSRTASPVVADHLWLDPFSFPGAGPREVRIELATATEQARRELIEIARAADLDDPRRHDTVLLSQDRPSATWKWFATSPFDPGVCWRVAGAQAWSEPTEGPISVTPTSEVGTDARLTSGGG